MRFFNRMILPFSGGDSSVGVANLNSRQGRFQAIDDLPPNDIHESGTFKTRNFWLQSPELAAWLMIRRCVTMIAYRNQLVQVFA